MPCYFQSKGEIYVIDEYIDDIHKQEFSQSSYSWNCSIFPYVTIEQRHMNTAGDMNMQPLSRHIQFDVGLLYGVYFFPFAFPFFPF